MGKRRPAQGEFKFVGWGGKRPGAGRKCRAARTNASRRTREPISREFAAHVTLRLCPGLANLRDPEIFALVLIALSASAFGLFFRIVEFSVQRNHLHLIIEAADTISLTAGIRALNVRIASALNKHLGRQGPVFADRFHTRRITSPRDARHALVYVFGNARKHAFEAGVRVPASWIDPRSSGPWFRGWSDADPRSLRNDPKPVASARSWLLTVGWRRHWQLITVSEMPATRATRPAKKR